LGLWEEPGASGKVLKKGFLGQGLHERKVYFTLWGKFFHFTFRDTGGRGNS